MGDLRKPSVIQQQIKGTLKASTFVKYKSQLYLMKVDMFDVPLICCYNTINTSGCPPSVISTSKEVFSELFS